MIFWMKFSFNNKYVRSIHKQACWEWAYSFLSGCEDGILVLLRNHQTGAIRGLQHIDDQIIGKHIQLFLLIACDIHLSRNAVTVFNETRTYTNIIESNYWDFKRQTERKMVNWQRKLWKMMFFHSEIASKTIKNMKKKWQLERLI